jgi:TPR repeat protein
MVPNDVFASSAREDDLVRAARGDVPSATRAGYRHLTGIAARIHLEQARAHFRAAANGSPAVPAHLAYIDAVDRKVHSSASLKVEALRTLKGTADAGEPIAQTLLAPLYERGGDSTLEMAPARVLYEAAAPKCVLPATYLARIHLRARRDEDAIAVLASAVAAGETYGRAHLASIYSRERPKVTRPVKAKKLLRSAPERGIPKAAYELGVQYYRDGLRGVLRAPDRALRLFGRAAGTGYPPAKAAVAPCYRNGIGGVPDRSMAQYWRARSTPQIAARVAATLSAFRLKPSGDRGAAFLVEDRWIEPTASIARVGLVREELPLKWT